MKLQFSDDEKKCVYALFDKCDVALLKVSMLDNGEKHIDNVFINGREYDIPSRELAVQLILTAGAVDLIREKGSILSLDKEQRNFVIQNHPTWMMLRSNFLSFENDSELYGTFHSGVKKPYEIWLNDNCDAIGERKFYPKKNMKSILMTYNEFVTCMKFDRSRKTLQLGNMGCASISENSSSLYRGFFEAVRVKNLNLSNLKVELNKYGYPVVSYLQNSTWHQLDVSDDDGLNKLLELSPSPLGKPVKKEKVKVKKKPTKSSKKRKK